jgi:hypothetical protein
MLETAPETKAPNIEAEAVWLPLVKPDLAQFPGGQPPIDTPLSQPKDSVSRSPAISVLAPQAISSASVLGLSPSVTQLAANPRTGDPLQSEIVAATGDIRTQTVVAPKIVQDLRVIVDHNLAQQTLQIEAARREANLSAGQLAITTRYNREQSGVAGARALLAGNGFDLEGGERQHDSEFGSQPNLLPDMLGHASFAAAVHDFEGNAGANSVLSQTVHQVIAMAESVNARLTRSLRLRLKPETLGQIEIELSRDASGRISAHISAERESARAALSQSLDQLREMLSRAGLSVDKLQIRAGPGLSAGNRESADARSDSRGSPTAIATAASSNEAAAIGALRADDQKFLSLRA